MGAAPSVFEGAVFLPPLCALGVSAFNSSPPFPYFLTSLLHSCPISSTPSHPDPSRSQTLSSLPVSSNPPPPPCRPRSPPQTPALHPAASKYPRHSSPDSAASLPSAKPHRPPPKPRCPNPTSAPASHPA